MDEFEKWAADNLIGERDCYSVAHLAWSAALSTAQERIRELTAALNECGADLAAYLVNDAIAVKQERIRVLEEALKQIMDGTHDHNAYMVARDALNTTEKT